MYGNFRSRTGQMGGRANNYGNRSKTSNLSFTPPYGNWQTGFNRAARGGRGGRGRRGQARPQFVNQPANNNYETKSMTSDSSSISAGSQSSFSSQNSTRSNNSYRQGQGRRGNFPGNNSNANFGSYRNQQGASMTSNLSGNYSRTSQYSGTGTGTASTRPANYRGVYRLVRIWVNKRTRWGGGIIPKRDPTNKSADTRSMNSSTSGTSMQSGASRTSQTSGRRSRSGYMGQQGQPRNNFKSQFQVPNANRMSNANFRGGFNQGRSQSRVYQGYR